MKFSTALAFSYMTLNIVGHVCSPFFLLEFRTLWVQNVLIFPFRIYYILLSILCSILKLMIAPFLCQFHYIFKQILMIVPARISFDYPFPRGQTWIQISKMCVTCLICDGGDPWWGKTGESPEPPRQPCLIFFSNLSVNVWSVLRPSGWRKSGIMSAWTLDVLENQLTSHEHV